jgi:hypothetical protein
MSKFHISIVVVVFQRRTTNLVAYYTRPVQLVLNWWPSQPNNISIRQLPRGSSTIFLTSKTKCKLHVTKTLFMKYPKETMLTLALNVNTWNFFSNEVINVITVSSVRLVKPQRGSPKYHFLVFRCLMLKVLPYKMK